MDVAKTPEQVIEHAINNGGNIALEHFRFLYDSKFINCRVENTTLGKILQGARMIYSDVVIPVQYLREMVNV